MPQKNSLLEKKICSISADYIFNEAVGSFLLLLMSCVENGNVQKSNVPYEIHKEILEIKKAVSHYVINLEALLTDNNQEALCAALDDCIDLKKDLLHIYGSIYRYYAEWNIASTILNDEVAIRKYKQENVSDKKIEFELFYRDCIEFLTSAENISEQKSYIGQLLKCIPFKMARDRYFDLVLKSLRLAFDEQPEEAVRLSLDTFRQSCAPEKFDSYGKYFPDIADWLSEKRSIKPSNMTEEELEEEYADFNAVFEILNKIEDYFSCIFNDINSLIILFYLQYPLAALLQNDFVAMDLYHSVCEFLSGDMDSLEKNASAERLHQLLEDKVEPIIDKATELNKQELRLLDQIESFDDLEESALKTLASESFIRSAYYENINDELFHFDIDLSLPPAAKEMKEKAFASFISFMRDYFAELPMQIRKPAMQQLLCSLPLAYEIEDILDQIRIAIEDAPDFEHKVLIVDKAGMVFQDNGFQYETEEFEEDDCDCGHHHHHGCDCGHHRHSHE